MLQKNLFFPHSFLNKDFEFITIPLKSYKTTYLPSKSQSISYVFSIDVLKTFLTTNSTRSPKREGENFFFVLLLEKYPLKLPFEWISFVLFVKPSSYSEASSYEFVVYSSLRDYLDMKKFEFFDIEREKFGIIKMLKCMKYIIIMET